MTNNLDKIKVARSFSRAASSYDSAAYFQREMGLELLSMLPLDFRSVKNVCCLDLGCGTGFFHQQLTSLYKGCDYLGVDIAEGMLNFFKDSLGLNSSSIKARDKNISNDFLFCADAENLSIKDESVDIVFSNMALQWSENLPAIFFEMNRILKPGGVVGLTTLGPQTLIELKQSWQQVDERVHVNNFFPLDQWQKAITENGLSVELQRVLLPKLQFDSVRQLLKELKLIGAHNINKGQPQGLLGKKDLLKLYSAYEAYKFNGYFPASYEVYFFVIKKS
jgi:malonyl-CoA O-methyltransferase